MALVEGPRDGINSFGSGVTDQHRLDWDPGSKSADFELNQGLSVGVSALGAEEQLG